MPRHILNVILPSSLRNKLRALALSTIPSMRHLDMPKRLRHLQRLGFSPKVILDIGAADGHWAQLAASIWPAAKIIGFEPNASNVPELNRRRSQIPQFDFRTCFLGPSKQAVEYKDRGTQTSIYGLDGTSSADAGKPAHATMETLDDLVSRQDIPPPQFIKIDVQGFELDVLRGAERTLSSSVQGLLIEVNFFKSHPQIPTADEVIAFLKERGFVWHDTAAMLRRPSDDAVWQMDLIFLRQDHPLRKNTQYLDRGA